MIRLLKLLVVVCLSFQVSLCQGNEPADSGSEDFYLVVMDPLAAPLSCPCVEGYAQRKYELLQAYLADGLGQKVQLVFAESMSAAMKKTNGKASLIIGKDSVVEADCALANFPVKRLGRLTDREGATDQYGLIVVNRDDPATSVADLVDYKIIFGPAESAEKHTAALKLLADAGVAQPEKLEIDEACSDGACKVIDLGPKSKTAAVISSYAKPLLEGCGTIKKGDLRVVGQTDSVPFITAFANNEMSQAEQVQLSQLLFEATANRELMDGLESLLGFVAIENGPESAKKK